VSTAAPGLFFDRLARLERERVAFALATVVARRAPVSSQLGDRAVVLADGTMDGFIGGSCSRDVLRRHALRALASGRPRLLRFRPDAEPDETEPQDAEILVPMGCASQGSVDVYIEPHLPIRRLLVVGDTPVADALARLAAEVPYDVVRVVDGDASAPALALGFLSAYLADLGTEAHGISAVVASQGHYDELALEALLAHDLAYLGLVASRRRAPEIVAALAARGIDGERLGRLRTPAGLDIGARGPSEVAIAILAELLTAQYRETTAERVPAIRVDPVCGMEVDFADASERVAVDGETVLFCGPGCRRAFEREPERYVTALTAITYA
jgi:xanthine dehydrogenase accessory factor